MDPRARLGGFGEEKPLVPAGVPRTIQPVAVRYTDYAIPVPGKKLYCLLNDN
jgi:hypothetical protein